MILLIGSEGSIGSRYKAILNKIKKDYVVHDGYYFEGFECFDTKIHDPMIFESLAKKADKFIIATPTDTHTSYIYRLAKYKKPILCEKPITKRSDNLYALLSFCRENKICLTMINQYNYAQIKSEKNNSDSSSVYNYFKHGSDGIAWDCINILGLAKGKCFLWEDSPIWECELNGHRIDFSDCDGMYLRMILDWIRNPVPNLEYIDHSHNKVFEYLAKK